MRDLILFTVIALFVSVPLPAAKTFDLYAIDVEGGKSVLYVSPSGETLLIDAGWPGNNDRDTNRILEVVKAAKVKRIDYLLVSHYDLDHVGNVPAIATKLPVGNFVDHGPVTSAGKESQELFLKYIDAIGSRKRISVKPGDTVPIKGLQVTVLTANGERLSSPLPGAGAPNEYCAAAQAPARPDTSENGRSIGLAIAYGKFRLTDFADLTRGREYELMCPNNPIGTVDLYMVSHHGLTASNSQVFVQALRPRVAIMNDGDVKGGAPAVTQILRSSPGLQDVWQMHYALKASKEDNAPAASILNSAEEKDCPGGWIKVSAQSDGTFTVTNSRTSYTKTYKR